MKYSMVRCFSLIKNGKCSVASFVGEIIVRKPLIPYDRDGKYVREIFTGEKIRVYDNYCHEIDKEYNENPNYALLISDFKGTAYMVKDDALNDPKNAVSKENILEYYMNFHNTGFFYHKYKEEKRKMERKNCEQRIKKAQQLVKKPGKRQ